MGRLMGWVKLDDNYRNHPKIVKAGPAGMALDIAAMCYSAAYLTDGFIPESAVGALFPIRNVKDVVDRLVKVDRWERDEPNAGYWVHDYLDYNPPASRVLADRDKERQKKRTQRRSPQGTYQGSPPGTPAGTQEGCPPGTPGDVPTVPSRPRPPVVNPSSDLRSVPPDEKPIDELELERLTRTWQAVLTEKGSNAPGDAIREAVRASLRFADARIVAERIGYLRETSKPRSAGYLLTTVENFMRDHHQPVPERAS